MEIKGRIIQINPLQTGSSARGTWKKQECILQTEEQFPRKICFVAWGDKIDEFALRVGDDVEVSIDLESREFNGRWYTDVKAWKVAKRGGSSGGGSARTDDLPLPPAPPGEEDMVMDDMPF